MNAASDAELVARCLANEQGAWDELVDRYARYVYAIAARVYRLEPTDAEDVFQEVFARVFERLDTLRDVDALRPWIAQTTRRCAVDAHEGRELPDDRDRARAPARDDREPHRTMPRAAPGRPPARHGGACREESRPPARRVSRWKRR